MTQQYWLLKTEPDAFSIDDLKRRGKQGEAWDGIRNYQARNFLREMKTGDIALIYHSACATPAIVGSAEVIRTAYPDASALNPDSKYYDPKSTVDNNRWSLVDIRYLETWSKPVPLSLLKQVKELAEMKLLKQSRLSVSPVTEAEYQVLQSLR